MDFRLVKETRRWMDENGYLSNCDVVSLAGASKEILDGGEEARELILKQINLANTLHGASEIILVHHSDCGAYKNAYNFASPEEEKNKQLEDMTKTEVMIKDKFANMRVTKIWAQLQDENGGIIDFQEVQ
jgi:hypothetical protein